MIKIKSTEIHRFIQAVTDLKIQGATAVAVATLDALVHVIISAAVPGSQSDWKKLFELANKLSQLRPTEPMARNLSRWLLIELKTRLGKIKLDQESWSELVCKVEQEFKYNLKEIDARLSEFGSKLVSSGETIFTHCHSSLAESILVRARKQNKKFKVYHTETRPLFQGRITSRHLSQAKIPSVMVSDSAAAWLVSNRSGDDVDVAWVLLGADSISRDGSVINKIGSFAIALSAHDSGIPLYIASSLLKLDINKESRIERRGEEEIWPSAPLGTKIVNYAFDRVPARYITGIVCEFGLLKPKEVLARARRHYPAIFVSAHKA